MPGIFRPALLLCLLLIGGNAFAQPTDPRFRFITATGAAGSVNYYVNGFDIKPAGFASGQFNGLVSYLPKSYTVKAIHPTLGHTDIDFDLRVGDNKALVLYISTIDPPQDGQLPKKALRFLMLNAANAKPESPTLTIVQVTAQPSLSVTVNGSTHHVPRTSSVQVSLDKISANIEVNGVALDKLMLPQKQEYFLVLFTDEQGKIKAVHTGT